MKIAAVADLHIGRISDTDHGELFSHMAAESDLILLCGDLTDRGTIEEAEVLAQIIYPLTIPVLAVLGNHDYEAGQEEKIKQILAKNHAIVLDGEEQVVKDIGFAGIKGFAGGFENHILQSWGEKAVKDFVAVSVNESLRLETALSKLETTKKIVVLHYAPITDTLEGEAKEIYPFLGSSRLVDPIDRSAAFAVFHGHAHHGTHKGKTPRGIAVYNVSYPVMHKLNPKKPYAIIEI